MSKKRCDNPCVVFPKRFNENGKPLCGVCGTLLKGRQRRWCSQECSNHVNIVTSPSFARHKVYQRDKGVCAKCGHDTQKLKRILRIARGRRYTSLDKRDLNMFEEREIKKLLGYTRQNHLWEMDHILPVVEGGGLCGLEGLQTLCIPCHRIDTKELAARRAKARRKLND